MTEYIDTAFKELDRLEDYLIGKGIPHERVHDAGPYFERNQIIVYKDSARKNRWWDAICQVGSYGYEEGLLEVMGEPVVLESDGDDVCGWLTADAVIKRFESYVNKNI